jgi:uncharacterized membrane protein YcgQ (UPF0703/DUF1980 family)
MDLRGRGRGDHTPRDQWVTVTGTLSPSSGDVPVVAASELDEISAPIDPYE